MVAVDLLGTFPRSPKYKRWTFCVDYLTRYTETAAMATPVAVEVFSFFLFITLRPRPPPVIVSDHDRQFVPYTVE